MNSRQPGNQGFFQRFEQIPFLEEAGRARARGFVFDLGIAGGQQKRNINILRAEKSHQAQAIKKRNLVRHDHQVGTVGGVESHRFLAVRGLENLRRGMATGHDTPDQEPDIFLKLNNDKTIVFHGTSLFFPAAMTVKI
jgi:hypothetical protein